MLDKLRSGMTACGYDEAMTLSAVEPSWIEAFPVWTSQPPLVTSTPVLRLADCLRQSLVPSLLAARRYNEKLSNDVIELFEIAHVYLPLGQEVQCDHRGNTSSKDAIDRIAWARAAR